MLEGGTTAPTFPAVSFGRPLRAAASAIDVLTTLPLPDVLPAEATAFALLPPSVPSPRPLLHRYRHNKQTEKW